MKKAISGTPILMLLVTKDTNSYARSGFRTGAGRDVGTNADLHIRIGQRSSNTRCADANDDPHARVGRQQ